MKAPTPLVTVLMPVYNGEKYLCEAIESILNQTFTDFEFLIIDDNSKDGSYEIIKRFNDKRIKLLRNSTNIGQTETLNLGLKVSKGLYIARLDQDDLALPQRLEVQVQHITDNPEIVLVGSWCLFIDGKDNNIGEFCPPASRQDIIDYIVSVNNPFPHSSVIFSRQVVNELGGYPDFAYGQDMALWLEIMRHDYEYAIMPDFLVKLRRHDSQAMQDPDKKYLRFSENIRLQKKAINLLDASSDARKSGRKLVKRSYGDFILYAIKRFDISSLSRLAFSPIFRN